MRARSRPKRESPELHRGPWQRIPRVPAGAESDFSIEKEGIRRLPRRRRHLIIFAFALMGACLWTAAIGWSRFENVFEWLGAVGAVGRGFVVVAGSMGVILAVGYYYTAGIDWPRETAGRLLVIGSVIGGFLVAAVAALALLEGRVAEFWPFLWKAVLGLGLLALLGAILRRR